MNTNINIDNYEAYLLDYMEGNLGNNETDRLKAFVAAQGLNWDELTEQLPQLEAPQIVYEDKEELKKKRAVVPLYVKIASAAAAAGLLLTVGLWPERQWPKMEPIAELKPISARINASQLDIMNLPSKPTVVIQPQTITQKSDVMSQRVEMPLLAELQPIKASETQIDQPLTELENPDFDLLTYRLGANLVFAQIPSEAFEAFEDDERNLSLISRGLLRLTEGSHDSFASLLLSGLSHAKQKASEAATDIAMTAYYRADEHIEEAKERWEERHEP